MSFEDLIDITPYSYFVSMGKPFVLFKEIIRCLSFRVLVFLNQFVILKGSEGI